MIICIGRIYGVGIIRSTNSRQNADHLPSVHGHRVPWDGMEAAVRVPSARKRSVDPARPGEVEHGVRAGRTRCQRGLKPLQARGLGNLSSL